MNQQLATTPFDDESTAQEVIAGVDLTGKRVVVTGGAAGLGELTATVLAGAGAEVTIVTRDLAAAEEAAGKISAAAGNTVRAGRVDLTDIASVQEFAASWEGPLHILINNAGVMAVPDLRLTSNGWEMQFATNHLGHFALALGLEHALAAAGGARIVELTSRGHLRSPVLFDDINFEKGGYDPLVAYGQSKTANVLFAVEAERRWADQGIHTNAVHPGSIEGTKLGRYIPEEVLEGFRTSGIFKYKNIDQGAATTVAVAALPSLEGVGGRYFENCNEAPVLDPDKPVEGESTGVAAYAVDPAHAEHLWAVSAEMLARAGY